MRLNAPTIGAYPKWLRESFNEFQTFYLSPLNKKVVKVPMPPISEVDLRSEGVHLKHLPEIRFCEYAHDIIHPTLSVSEEEASPVLSRS